jgi:hypothetical protein
VARLAEKREGETVTLDEVLSLTNQGSLKLVALKDALLELTRIGPARQVWSSCAISVGSLSKSG